MQQLQKEHIFLMKYRFAGIEKHTRLLTSEETSLINTPASLTSILFGPELKKKRCYFCKRPQIRHCKSSITNTCEKAWINEFKIGLSEYKVFTTTKNT